MLSAAPVTAKPCNFFQIKAILTLVLLVATCIAIAWLLCDWMRHKLAAGILLLHSRGLHPLLPLNQLQSQATCCAPSGPAVASLVMRRTGVTSDCASWVQAARARPRARQVSSSSWPLLTRMISGALTWTWSRPLSSQARTHSLSVAAATAGNRACSA